MSASSPRPAINSVSSANLRQIKTSALGPLLADTPPFAIGLLGFAVLTALLILKKVNLASLYLLSSVLLTFFGALIDLGQLYLRHAHSTESPCQRFIPSLMIIREVLYSIASGLRFLFYWVFVSQPPLCEQDSARLLGIHSGSWLRWGLTGSFLRWTTLAASLSVSVLQALWRTVHPLHEFGPVYDIEGAVEITISAIFIVKLLLNVLVVEVPSRRRQTLWQYSSVLSALLINMGIGIGNLMHFAFSETTLGRLLLAAEFHILVVSIVVFTFYSTKPTEGSTRSSWSKRASSFRGLHVSFYDSGPGLPNPNRTSGVQSRPPSVQNMGMSSWLGARNTRSRPPSQFGPMPKDGKRLRAEESERGLGAYPSEKAVLSVTGDMIPDSEQSTRRDDPIHPTSAVNPSVVYPLAPAISEGPSSPALPGQFSAGSAYDTRKASSPSVPGTAAMAASLTGLDSPVLGPSISARRKNTRSSSSLQPLRNASFASSGASDYDYLLREIDLERSIAALREFASTGRRGEEGQVGRDTLSDLPERGTAESSTTGNRHASASGKSDFSLSVFPEPPQMRQFEVDYRVDRRSSLSSVVLRPRISISTAGRWFPTSSGDGGTILELGLRTASVGTRYDVTSFIGDLTSPDESSTRPWVSDTDSESGSAIQATIVTVERKTSSVSRPRLVRRSLVTDTPTSAISRIGGLDNPSVRGAATDAPTPNSPISALGVPPPPAIYTRGGATRPLAIPTKRVVGLPSRPKPDTSFSADRQNEGVLDTPVPGSVPVVT